MDAATASFTMATTVHFPLSRQRARILFVFAIAFSICLVDAAILRVGNPLDIMKVRPHLQNVRISGVEQFSNHYNRCKGVETPEFRWGDEVEYGVFRKQAAMGVDALNLETPRQFDLSLRGAEIREYLNTVETEDSLMKKRLGCNWTPEYGSWMVEAVPRDPYGGHVGDLLDVEKSMQLRRKRLHLALRKDEVAPSMSNFPMLGVLNHGYSHNAKPRGPIANSLYVSDSVINPHPRFGALTENIRLRRGSNVEIMVKADKKGAGDIPAEVGGRGAVTNSNSRNLVRGDPDNIHMDAMAFGMGSCCLQITMQCKTERESRYLHDQLTVLSPIFMALSAATPMFKGRLVDTDCRWDVISMSVDDRTSVERGLGLGTEMRTEEETRGLVQGGKRRLRKSRYSGISRYISMPRDREDEKNLETLNDIEDEQDEDALHVAQSLGLDSMMAKHIAHMFTRDPLVVFDDAIYLDNNEALDHFDNVQSTNWRTVRWKAPAMNIGHSAQKSRKRVFRGEDGPGWRVEFRPLELQLTDFENAAFSILTVLLSRAMLSEGFKFFMPISCVDENMQCAHSKDAVTAETFKFPRNAFQPHPKLLCDEDTRELGVSSESVDMIEVTLDELFNGKGPDFPGFIPVVTSYLDKIGTDALTKGRILPYLHLLQMRASGELPTTARWLRNQVEAHSEYMGDGKLTPSIVDDIIQKCEDVGMGTSPEPSLVGGAFIENLNYASVEEKEPFLKENYDKLVASGVMDAKRQYKPENSCSIMAPVKSEDEVRESDAASKGTPFLESCKCE